MKKISTTKRLSLMRKYMKIEKVDAYIVNSEDNHFNEYVHPSFERRAFISGFQGSTGTAVITQNAAALWTDGRYFEEASRVLDNNWTLMKLGVSDVPSIDSWLSTKLKPISYVGYDPMTSSFKLCSSFQSHSAVYKIKPITNGNLVDLVWKEMDEEQEESFLVPRQKLSFGGIRLAANSFAGQSIDDKIKDLKALLKSKGYTMFVMVQLDEVNWFFNSRGSDIPFSNTYYAYSIVTTDNVYLFIPEEAREKSGSFVEHLHSLENKVIIEEYENFNSTYAHLLKEFGLDKETEAGSKVLFSISDSDFIVSQVPEANRAFGQSPVALQKAKKNEAELSAAISGHLMDSVVLCEFFSWLDQLMKSNTDPVKMITRAQLPEMIKVEFHKEFPEEKFILTEYQLAKVLDLCRKSIRESTGPSFTTILSIGSNSSVIHYHPLEKDCQTLGHDSIVLCDSGGQYESICTTDVTRTFSFMDKNDPKLAEFISDYTLVTRSHVNLAKQVFPYDTAGSKLDLVARHVMWSEMKDYKHGTGHGVGANLCVHEGPVGFSGSRMKTLHEFGLSEPGIQENMILTIEPGYYEEGKYGIRIENCYYTQRHKKNDSHLVFVPLTLVPFSRSLIDTSKLSSAEIDWINYYNRLVWEKVESVSKQGSLPFKTTKRMMDWVREETQPLNKSSS